MQVCHLETTNSKPTDSQDTVLALQYRNRDSIDACIHAHVLYIVHVHVYYVHVHVHVAWSAHKCRVQYIHVYPNEYTHWIYQYTCTLYLLSDLLDCTDGGAIQVVLVASGLNEEVGLNVLLHLLHTRHEMIVSSVDLSLSRLTSSVWGGEVEGSQLSEKCEEVRGERIGSVSGGREREREGGP